MDDIDNSKKSRERKKEEHLNEIAVAIQSYLRKYQITTGQYVSQENHLKEIEKHFIDLSHQPALKQREILQVKILSGISPRELFVLKTVDESHANEFHRNFHHDYDKNQHDSVYCLKTGIFCVAKTASNGWQRCRVLRLHAKSMCTAFLLDIGLREHINWMDLRMLDAKWCRQKPFAIRCSLIDVVSANPIDRCTLQQQQQLLQLLRMHWDFFISVNRSGTISSDIFLYYVMDTRFYCINEIFPSRSTSTDDEATDDVDDDGIDETISSGSRTKTAVEAGASVDADVVMRSNATSTFVTNDRSSEQMSVLDENQNELKKDSTANDIEMQEPGDHAAAMPKRQPTVLDQQLRLSMPEAVIVQHIDETGSIFVNFKKHKAALKFLRFEILKHTINDEDVVERDDADLTWNVNDYCLVYGKFDGIAEWLRGKITQITTASAGKDVESLAQVYLRDIGTFVEIPLNKLKRSIESIQNVRDFAWKLRLAFIEIEQRDGETAWIGKKLRKMLHAYDEIEISVLNSSAGQLNVILWGLIRNVRAMLPEKIELTNINEELANHGYAVASTEFQNINDLVGSLRNVTPDTPCYDSDNLQSNPTTLHSNFQVTDQLMDFEEWLPSEPILRREFTAIPMYVSHKCVLSILDADRSTVADQMKTILARKDKANELECRDATDWNKEDPCFVRFSADKQFYRGSVRRVNLKKNTCMVRFIDYGNCASCSLDDLRKANMFGNIPVLSRLYQLDNIRPLAANETWPAEVSAFCSMSVVEKQCNVIVIDDLAASKSPYEPAICKLEIFTKDKDLASALVANGLAQWIQPLSNDTTA